MELIVLGLAALFCAPLLKGEPDKEEKPDKPSDHVVVVIVNKDGSSAKASK